MYYRWRRMMCFVAIIALTLFVNSKMTELFYYPPLDPIREREWECRPLHEPVDVVYTWVNGTDDKFMDAIESTNKTRSPSPSRFYDMNQLMYSIRSVDRYAAWTRDIYIVTNGQVPSWLNASNPRIKLVTHRDIFTNHSNLPTFNSAAIESQLHHINGLSRRFLYFNDDVALLRPICLEDFYTRENGYVLYPKKAITPYGKRTIVKCTKECIKVQSNGHCNQMCNTVECLYDGGDCDHVHPIYQKPSGAEAYHQSVNFVNYLLDTKFKTTVNDRKWLPHMAFLIDRDVMRSIERDFPIQMKQTAAHQMRAKNDVQYEMMYYYYIMESPKGYKYELKPEEVDVDYVGLRNTAVDTSNPVYFIELLISDQNDKYLFNISTPVIYRNHYLKNRYHLKRIRQNRKKFICLNDIITWHGSMLAQQTYNLIDRFYLEFFPNATAYEL